jgi:methionine-rich copper-binding protein CopC
VTSGDDDAAAPSAAASAYTKVAMNVSQGGLGRELHTVSRVAFAMLALVGLLMAGVVLQAEPAEAHARCVAMVPDNNARIDSPPERVAVMLDNKPATLEGDPLRVYGPSGERVDAGDVEIADPTDGGEPAELSVGLSPDRDMPLGEYHVVYRVVSIDTHLIAGRFMFRYGEADGTSLLPFGASPDDSERLAPGWAADQAHWPKLVFVAGITVALVGVMVQRRRRTRRARVHGAQALSTGLLAGRRLD